MKYYVSIVSILILLIIVVLPIIFYPYFFNNIRLMFVPVILPFLLMFAVPELISIIVKRGGKIVSGDFLKYSFLSLVVFSLIFLIAAKVHLVISQDSWGTEFVASAVILPITYLANLVIIYLRNRKFKRY